MSIIVSKVNYYYYRLFKELNTRECFIPLLLWILIILKKMCDYWLWILIILKKMCEKNSVNNIDIIPLILCEAKLIFPIWSYWIRLTKPKFRKLIFIHTDIRHHFEDLSKNTSELNAYPITGSAQLIIGNENLQTWKLICWQYDYFMWQS